MNPIHCEEDLFALGAACDVYAAIAAWADLGLFDVMSDAEPRTIAELDGDDRALLITARMLAHVGLLVGDGDRWAMSRSALKLHRSGDLGLRGAADHLNALSRTKDVLQNGGPATGPDGESKVTQGGVTDDDPERTRKFLDMLHRRSRVTALDTALWISRRLEKGRHILDLGGGHGRYAEELVNAGFRVTLFDTPMVVDLARERHGDKLSYETGDFFLDPLGGGPYDGVLLSNIVHGNSAEQNLALFRKLHGVMSEGGLLVLKDMFLDEFGNQPQWAATFGLTMLFYTPLGSSYTLQEVYGWCKEAGFTPEQPVAHTNYSLVMARK